MGSNMIKALVLHFFAEKIFGPTLTVGELWGHMYPPENVSTFGFWAFLACQLTDSTDRIVPMGFLESQ
jgi:hypothetical protein